jgi:hypothetical protein
MTLLSLRVSWGKCWQRYAVAVRGFRSVEATRRMERNCRSRHVTLWRSLKAPQPPESPRERYGPGDALAGAIQYFSPRSATRAALSFSKEGQCPRNNAMED